jgi:predicted pyridoxine 5'-phosphate oxidase superfamily flavin-nucleotide-binding protein
MTDAFYTDAQRAVQDTHDSRPLADTLEFAIVSDTIPDEHGEFIASRDFFFLSTVNAAGEPTVSHKGGGVGVVRVLDSKTLAFPAYDGNGMFLSMGNITDTAKIGLLFIDFETPHRVRVQATASYTSDLDAVPDLAAVWPGAIGVVQATVDSVFVNCARYIHPHTREAASRHVPADDGSQPHATWKRIDLLQDALSDEDRARTEQEGAISMEDYAERLSAGES